MSFTVTMYRAHPGVGPPHRWKQSHFLPLGTIDEVRRELERHLPGLQWRESERGWVSADGPDPAFIAHRKEGEAGWVELLSIINPDRALLLALTQDTDRLLFDGEACELVDPLALTR